MRTETFEFKGSGGMKLAAMIWLPDGEPRMVLQIAHGMTEHIGRYAHLAGEMTAQGIVVAGYDLRGHGKTSGGPDVASFGEDGWEASLEDMRLFFDFLAARFAGLPHALLGFSLGSFLLREYLGRWSEDVDGAIIMGTGHQPLPVLAVIMAIVKGQIRKGGFDRTTDLVRKLSFGAYNAKFAPNRTAQDWLCADEAQLDQYIADPRCRRDISSGLFWQLLDAMRRTGARDACAAWKKDLPVLLLSGQDDPVGDFGRGVQAVRRQMDAAGMRRVTVRLIPGARHAVLDERKSGADREARRAILEWMLG